MALSSGRSRSPRLLVAGLVAASLLTITVDYREQHSGPLAAAGRAAVAFISPMQEAVSKVTHPVGNFFSTLVRLPAIRAENTRLRNEVADLQTQISVLGSQNARLHTLEDLFGVRESLGPETRTVAAQVVSNGVSNFEWNVTIGAGSSDGIKVNDPVVVGTASRARLVGHVIRVASNASIVQLLIDPESNVAGRLGSADGEAGVVRGQGNQDMRMLLIPVDSQVVAGSEVTTAGFRVPGVGSSQYPPNVLIGTVSRVNRSDAATEKYVTVRPAVDFSSLDIVLVVLSRGGG